MTKKQGTQQAVVPQLGELEEQVMNLLWTQSRRSVREVMDALPQRPAYTTIATVMQNLVRKTLVDTEREGRLVFYRARLSREEYAAQVMRQALETSHDRAASILHLVKAMPSEELDMLREYLGAQPSQDPTKQAEP
ncbi:BlaI/MecI/CopY family transcriptional regulator [Nesterenkonia sp.]|uniref:BlaI/MecI/CopY family transcriptional regulator n=1 Tax=Nesterenkonia sp. TaxID=704201 RepID=UPI002634F59C|nr:BlaI/MecI/CopY family transcriptional regulator [Nesterenkonia sp.]